ncbi:thioesterase family protein [Lacinutrix sp.]|uniref:acyl-CoA thioesterase n=1 Tax=Lacinutrix sp. TaxID=1937692 RepID=UPI0025BFC921|nr:thioesterase family protein [Lacinutrix sp.]
MQNFTKTVTVSKEDLDDLNHVNNVRYIEWVNSIAKAHWIENASEKILDNHFWILLSHTIDYKKPAFLKDELLLKTYVLNAEGVTSTRIVEIYNNKTQVLLAKSQTKWCFISSQTKKPSRITEDILKLFS